MAYPLIEFGLSEFAIYEFGYEQGSQVVGASFIAKGQGTAVFNTLVLNLFEAAITGSSQASFDAQTIKRVEAKSFNGFSTGTFEGNVLRNADIRSTSESDAYFNPSYVIESAMSGNGFGDFVAVYADPETFDARGRSIVRFVSGYAFTSDMNSSGVSKLTLDNFAYSDALTNIAGTSSISLKPGTWSVAGMDVKGVSAFIAPSQLTANSGLHSSGLSCVSSKTQAVKAGNLVSLGKGTLVLISQYTSNSGFNSVGSSTTFLKLAAVNVAVLEAIGISTVKLRPGSPVSEFLPPAWDVVIRPYENRGAIWK